MRPPFNTLKLMLLFLLLFMAPSLQLFSRSTTDSLLRVMQFEKDPVKRIQFLYQLGNSYRQSNNDSASVFYKKGLSNSMVLKEDSLIGLGYYYLATFETKRNNLRPALRYTDSAIKYAEQANNLLQLVILKKLKSNIYLMQLNAETKLNRTVIKKQQRTSTILLGTIAVILIFAALMLNRYHLKKKIEKQQALLDERKRISHELHDDLGAQLCAVRLFMINIQKNAQLTNDDKTCLDNSLSLIDTTIKDLRHIMNDLRTPVLVEDGYIAATTALVNKLSQLKQVKFNILNNGMEKRFGYKKENNLYRITQELINNTLKYANAKNVTIDVQNRDNNVVLMYEDDGIGFNMHAVKKGCGLDNIESRSRALGGTVAFDSWPGYGFRAKIEIPLLYA